MTTDPNGVPAASQSAWRRWPLYLRILLGVVLGAALGASFGTRPIVHGFGTQDLGALGLLVVRLLKALAVPLIFFAIVDALLRAEITARSGRRLVLICLLNVSVAFAIGLTLLDVLRPGERWRGHLEELAGVKPAEVAALPPGISLNPIKSLDGYVPTSLPEPFLKNSVIGVVLLALFVGAALRRARATSAAGGVETVVAFVEGVYATLMLMLQWVIETIPFAVLAVVAGAVGRAGFDAFAALGSYVGVILAGLGLHALVYYPAMAWLVGRKSPRVYLGGGAEAILTGLSTNSSLATVPLTLRCLTEKMGVSERSARLSACIGTNLNNDGITLYDAMAALFLAQACGFDLDLGQQAVIVLSSLMAGVGIAGIPEAGLIVLPVVLSAAGLPEAVVAAAIPLVLPVDWIIGRARSAVNVMSDMLVAILLDRGDHDAVAPAVLPVTVDQG
jgi:DAACS family dicarboxylate/amino acid:cation (Na+ or H+) symporter